MKARLKIHVAIATPSWIPSAVKNIISGGSGAKKYCDKRLCDACFKNEAPLKLTCRKNECQAQISYDLKHPSHIYDDYLNYLVFICPLDEPCNQQLTYADFIKHTHQIKKIEKKKEKKRVETAHEPLSRDENLRQSKGEYTSQDISDSSAKIRSPTSGVTDNSRSKMDRNHSSQQPARNTNSSLYPGKYYPDGKYDFVNGDAKDCFDNFDDQQSYSGMKDKKNTTSEKSQSTPESTMGKNGSSYNTGNSAYSNADKMSESKPTKTNDRDAKSNALEALQIVQAFVDNQGESSLIQENNELKKEIKELKDQIAAHACNSKMNDEDLLRLQNEYEKLVNKYNKAKNEKEGLRLAYREMTENIESEFEVTARYRSERDGLKIEKEMLEKSLGQKESEIKKLSEANHINLASYKKLVDDFDQKTLEFQLIKIERDDIYDELDKLKTMKTKTHETR
ncbi:unnamed protein product [Oikopleura dioica]|uniref:Uncharacterized protein n=1 Tax=Oikopleura dioica TaxID=34765 RepID=E4XKS5_OIKDI|nr:unnamed protein product [Oikopleura dioica]